MSSTGATVYSTSRLTPTHHPIATRGKYTVIPLRRAHPSFTTHRYFFLSSPFHPLMLSLAGLVGRGQSIVGKSSCIKTKRSLGLGPPIIRTAFDGTPQDSDDNEATTSRRLYRES